MATISNTPRPGYVWDSTDNVWYPIGVGAHQHTNAADTPAVMPYSTYAAAGKNKIINGDFAINQRAFTSITSGAYCYDRWTAAITNGGGTATFSAQTFTLGTAPVSGYEGTNFFRCVTSGQANTDARAAFRQNIESVRTFAGQTVTISFWAKAGSGTPSLNVEMLQVFGSGGSPSTELSTVGAKQAITTSWARYTWTLSIPSISGKTIGTAGGDMLRLNIWASAGSNWDSTSGTLGIQNNTFDIWGVQVEAGSTATAFQTATGNPASELAACQRYYYRNAPTSTSGTFGTGIGYSTAETQFHMNLPVTMRVRPTALDTSATNTFAWFNGTLANTPTSIGLEVGYTTTNIVAISFVKSGAFTAGTFYILYPNTTASAYIGVSAEL